MSESKKKLIIYATNDYGNGISQVIREMDLDEFLSGTSIRISNIFNKDVVLDILVEGE